jgi:hypothetical protein
MSDGDDFLARWSRRKRAVADAERAAAQEPPAADLGSDETMDAAPGAPADQPSAVAAPEAEFDIAHLPPIESIGADTDISAFLKPGVPSALRHAALRRAWTTDPVIRSFKGLAENDWDFTSPDTPGFGPLDPGFDVKAMLAQLFGEAPPPEPDAQPDPQPLAQRQAVPSPSELDVVHVPATNEGSTKVGSDVTPLAATQENIVQRDSDGASQQDATRQNSLRPPLRKHGSALPRVLPD